MAFSVAQVAGAKAFRISPADTNYFVMLFDRETDKIENIFVIEIFKAGGATPPNEHASAHEFFHVLHGEGVARCDGKTLSIRKGDSLLLHPGSEHVIENTGAGKLYTLTVMTPNEGFAELLIRQYFRSQRRARNPYFIWVAELHVSSKILTT